MKKLIKKLISLLPIKNLIVFESTPNLSDNTKAVYDEMIKRGLNKKYKMVWIVKGTVKQEENLPGVKFCDSNAFGFDLKLLYYRMFAKALICCNYFLTTFRKRQTSFYLSHGTCLKSVRSYYNLPDNIDYMFSASEETKQIASYELKCPIEKVVALGFPRNDILTKETRDIKDIFQDLKNEKIVMWYPTFRQHKSANLTACAKALPIIDNHENALKLNEIAKKNNILILLKPHFAQDLSKINFSTLSNIKLITDSFYEENNISAYEFIAGCDALLTDYSSIYYDFLLCDKPIGLIWEDYEEYKKNVDFAVDMDEIMKAGEKIYNLDDFEKFLINLATGNDTLKNERAEINKWANYSTDGKNAERVTDFIIKTAGL